VCRFACSNAYGHQQDGALHQRSAGGVAASAGGQRNSPEGGGDWRVRTGDYRIIYGIRDAQPIVLVLPRGPRQDV